MSLFSQRKGIRPLQKAVQREAMDDALRNGLWSALKLVIWDNYSPPREFEGLRAEARQVLRLVEAIWLLYFKKPVDTIPRFDPDYSKSAYHVLREYFFGAKWWEALDFLEFVVKNAERAWGERLSNACNRFLEAENAAYRFVGSEIVEITSEYEIAAVETALESSGKVAARHLARALELISDKKQPDYRNSIKESVSAVEAVCRLISGSATGTLGECLKMLKAKAPIHPALETAFSKLYGYTSDSGGIRHALTDPSESPSFADAKFMLVACSAFISYLLAKAAESGLKLPEA